MNGSLRIAIALATAALAAATGEGLAAQQRRPAFGTVVDARGDPLVGAAVTVVWSPPFDGPPDVAQATTDDRGRFRTDLVVGRGYTAWAVGVPAADGSCAVTEVTDHFAAGSVRELRAEHAMAPRSVQLQGHAQWRDDAPAQLRWYPDANHALAVALEADAAGRVTVPPGPEVLAALDLLDADGHVADSQPLAPDAAEVAFHPPMQVLLTVVDGGGAPLAGAPVERQVRPRAARLGAGLLAPGARWARAGTTDARGQATVRIAMIPRRDVGWLRVAGAGTTQAYAPASAAMPSTHGPDELELVVRRLAAPTRPLAHELKVRAAWCGAEVWRTDHERPSLDIALDLRAGDGALALRPEPDGYRFGQCVLELHEEAGVVPRLALLDEAQLAGGEVDLTALRTFRLRAVDLTNSPLAGATVLVHRRGADRSDDIDVLLDRGGPGVATAVHLGPTGVAELLLPAGEFCLYVAGRDLHEVRFLDDDEAGGELELRPQPFPTRRLRVVDDSGAPVAFARVERDGAIAGFGGRLQGWRGHTKEGVAAAIALPIAVARRSDADGMLEVPVQDWRPMTVPIRVRAGDRVSASFPLAPSDEVIEVVVR